MSTRIRAALSATPFLTFPYDAHAFWGDENWGEMYWGVIPSVPLPVDQLWWPALLWLSIVLLGMRLLTGTRSRALVLLLLALSVPLAAVATTISMPYIFSNGTIADADEVNANFDTIVLESNAQDARVTALEASEITDITAGTGLSGGGAAGSVALAADTAYLQRRVSSTCAAGSSIRAIDSTGTVTCETDSDSGGDITGVSSGTGLVGGGTTGAVTVSADTGYLQRRVSATCAAGSSIRAISSTGTVTCETDDAGIGDITGVSAGSGLSGGGTTGSVTLSVPTSGITATHIASNAVGSSEIAANSVYAADIAADAVGSSELASGAVFNANVAASAAIAPSKIAGTAATLNYTTQNFGNVLYLDNTNNEVGINDTTPSYALDVSGTVAATDFRYRSTQTFYHALRASDFRTTSSGTSWITVGSGASYGYTNDDVTDYAYATLHLPDGANISNLTCYYYDNHATWELEDFDITLYSNAFGSTGSSTLASVVSDPANYADTTVRSLTDSTVSGTGDPVNNASYAYSVRVAWDLASTGGGGTSTIRFYGCRVGYQITTLGLP